MDIYFIKWCDAFACDKWVPNEDLLRDSEFPLIIKSVGFLFKKTNKYIVLV